MGGGITAYQREERGKKRPKGKERVSSFGGYRRGVKGDGHSVRTNAGKGSRSACDEIAGRRGPKKKKIFGNPEGGQSGIWGGRTGQFEEKTSVATIGQVL